MEKNDNTPWQYKPDSGAAAPDNNTGDDSRNARPKAAGPKTFAWEAPEFIEHQHGPGWYAALAIATFLIALIIYLAARDIIAIVITATVGIIVGIFAAQKPGQARYEITSSGMSINGKPYNFGDYKSFAVIREGELSSVNLFPLKRLMPPLSAYFDPTEEQNVVQAIGSHLPYEDRKLDGIDRLTRRLRL